MKQLIIDAMLVTLVVIVIVLTLAAGMSLDDDFTPPATQDATEAARCDERNPTCTANGPHAPTQDQINDPRVQRSLRRLCGEGQTWACKLVNKNGGVL